MNEFIMNVSASDDSDGSECSHGDLDAFCEARDASGDARVKIEKFLKVHFPNIPLDRWLDAGHIDHYSGFLYRRECMYTRLDPSCEDDEVHGGCLCIFPGPCEVNVPGEGRVLCEHSHCACGEAILHEHVIAAIDPTTRERIGVVVGSHCIRRFAEDRMCSLCHGRRTRDFRHEHGLCETCVAQTDACGIDLRLLRPKDEEDVRDFVRQQRALGDAGRRAFRENLLRVPVNVRTYEYPKSWVERVPGNKFRLKVPQTAACLFERIDFLRTLCHRRREHARRGTQERRRVVPVVEDD